MVEIKIVTSKVIDITEEDFKAYEEVRIGGATNMFNISLVSDLSGLSRDKIIGIMDNYVNLLNEFEK